MRTWLVALAVFLAANASISAAERQATILYDGLYCARDRDGHQDYFVVCSPVPAANERETWIIGRWTSHIEGRPDRTIVFHADHSWGVEHYGAPGANGQLTIYEELDGRRWDIRGERLVLRAPSDDGFESYGEKIISFGHDKIVTDIAIYTREQPRK